MKFIKLYEVEYSLLVINIIPLQLINKTLKVKTIHLNHLLLFFIFTHTFYTIKTLVGKLLRPKQLFRSKLIIYIYNPEWN